MAKRANRAMDEEPSDWVADNTLIYGLGVGLHETLQYLFYNAPEFEAFERWILEKNGGAIDPARIARINAALSGSTGPAEAPVLDAAQSEPVLSAADLEFWETNGYVVVHDAVPPETRQAAESAIYEFLGMDPAQPDTWYSMPHGHSIWVPLLHHPALWANRNSPRIHRAFAQLWGRSDLWVTVDQAGLNPPERPGWPFPGPHLHWDSSIAQPMPFGTQGILYLVDVAADQGAFTCVPGFQHKLSGWLRDLPPGADPRAQDLKVLSPVPIAGRAGDLIIWHHALPHGASPNRAARPRVVQYINMRPSQWDHSAVWV
jgi:hypothetical protein